MKILKKVYDKDVFPSPEVYPETNTWVDRPTCKAIIFNSKNEIALIGNKINNYFLLPGGGIEENEKPQEAILRECMEETGCQIIIIKDLGVTEDFRERDKRHSLNFCYLCKVSSYGEPNLTEKEKDVGAYIVWFPLNKVLQIFDNQERSLKEENISFYNTGFNIIRDNFFLKEVDRMFKENKDFHI